MKRRQLSISDLARFRSGVEADLFDGNAVLDEAHCSTCGSELVETSSSLFQVCESCGHVVGDVEDGG